MATEFATRPTATMYEVEALVGMAWRGEIRLPDFQRDFHWQRRDVIRLFDSIARGYPIGSLLLWRHPAAAQTLYFGALRVEAPPSEQALWVVDGQQRITSLANALHEEGMKDDRFNLAYDLEQQQFTPLPPVEDPFMIPLPVVFDLHKLLQWFTQYPEIARQLERVYPLTTALRQFPVSAYEVTSDDGRVVIEIFERLNSYGRRLSRSEVSEALFAGDSLAHEGHLTLARISENIDNELGFGTIERDIVFQAILARRGPDPTRDVRYEFDGGADVEVSREDRDTAYRLGGEALRRAVRFLQADAGVPHVTMLPYRHLLVVLARFFAHHVEPAGRYLRLLRRWFWRAAVLGPENVSGSTTDAARTLCFAVRRDNLARSIEELLGMVDRPERPRPDLRTFRTGRAETRIVLCSWWSEGPRSLRHGEPVGRDSLSTCLLDRPTASDAIRRIVARPEVPDQYRLWAANRVLLPESGIDATAVGSLLRSRPPDVGEREWQATLRSHMLDDQMTATLAAGDVTSFLTHRQQVLQEQLTTFLQNMCEWGFEDTPPLTDLVVEDLRDGDDEAA